MWSWSLGASIIVAVAAYLLFSGFLKTYRTYRGVRVITCPENLQPAAVSVAAFDAAKWFAVSGDTDLHLKSCSRWPEMGGCAQDCLAQVEASPESCLARAMVSSWYAEKSCHFCGRAIEQIVWHERPPAILRPDGTTQEWKSVPAERLPSVFATCEPVCWACHLVESFRREHPQMVIERVHQAVAARAIPPSVAVY